MGNKRRVLRGFLFVFVWALVFFYISNVNGIDLMAIPLRLQIFAVFLFVFVSGLLLWINRLIP